MNSVTNTQNPQIKYLYLQQQSTKVTYEQETSLLQVFEGEVKDLASHLAGEPNEKKKKSLGRLIIDAVGFTINNAFKGALLGATVAGALILTKGANNSFVKNARNFVQNTSKALLKIAEQGENQPKIKYILESAGKATVGFPLIVAGVNATLYAGEKVKDIAVGIIKLPGKAMGAIFPSAEKRAEREEKKKLKSLKKDI